MVGQEHIVRTLRNSLKTGRIRHAYLFSGPRGTGKTTSARLLAKAVNCQDPDPDKRPCNQCHACIAVNEGRYLDLIEIDAATNTGVDDVRDLRDKIAFTPTEGTYKVYIIDEVHRFSGSAFDALLKTLEEPPDHAIFVLATTEIDKVPPTIKSRCLQFEFRRLSLAELTDRLEQIAQEEGLNIERAALEVIARQGTGSARDSISLLDQIVSDPAEVITLEVVQRILGTGNTLAVKELVEALIERQAGRGLHVINAAVDSGSDPRQFGQQVVEHLRAVLLAQTASADLVEASDENRALFQEQAGRISRPMLLAAIRAFNEAVNNYRGGWQPQLSLELAFIESIRQPEEEHIPAPSVGTRHAVSAQPQKSSVPEVAPQQVEATPPGAPPVIPASTIEEQWEDFLKALFKRNPTGPAVVEHFRVYKVEGNQVFLCTSNQLYFDRLYQQTPKLALLEQVLREIHGIPLRVQVVLVDNTSHPKGRGKGKKSKAEVEDDPVISEALELGAQIRYDEDDSG
jgi:DNA polymerase-3 subunit gamma/tau